VRVKHEKLILLILLFAVTAACIVLWYWGSLHFFDRVDYRIIQSDDGVYDMSGFDFENAVIRIEGSVEFIPDALLSPEEFESRASVETVEIGKPQDVSNVATSRVRLIFPDDNTYMIAEKSVDYAETIFINGEQRGRAGQPGITKESEEAGFAFWSFSVKPINGVAEIIRQTSNFVHRDNGNHANLIIGSEENIRLYMSLATDFDGISTGLFFALFIVHLTLYFILRSYRANLYFAVLCLTWALRKGVIGTKIFLSAIPFLNWETAFRIEYLSVPVGAVFVMLYIGEILPSVAQKWATRIAIGASSLFVFPYLFADTKFMSYAMLGYSVFYTAVIVWMAARFVVKLPGRIKRGELLPEHFASLFGLGVFLYAAVHDAFYYNNIHLFGLHSALTEPALLIFSFSQMIAMSRGTMREVAAARETEQKLALENAALDRMNRMKSDLMANLTHEMRTPLTVMSTYAQLAVKALRNENFDEQTTADLETINQEAKRLADMASGTLNVFGKNEEYGQLYPVSVDVLLNQIARLFNPLLKKQENRILLELARQYAAGNRERG